jgi:hypothetical protein
VYLVCVFAFDLCVMFIVFVVFFVFILVPCHKSHESVKIGPHPRGHPSSVWGENCGPGLSVPDLIVVGARSCCGTTARNLSDLAIEMEGERRG